MDENQDVQKVDEYDTTYDADNKNKVSMAKVDAMPMRIIHVLMKYPKIGFDKT
ncbi:hypothetical protein [Paenibacillus terrigena]|uniref:hypothetical protein n=1 Tax=Paenibacillus terrigena TaxID=369333 RepID=UPI0028D789E5|nr:hypothetical protein [Paenibacillus terrigena]